MHPFSWIFNFVPGTYVLVITARKEVGTYLGYSIYRVKSMRFLSCNEALRHLTSQEVWFAYQFICHYYCIYYHKILSGQKRGLGSFLIFFYRGWAGVLMLSGYSLNFWSALLNYVMPPVCRKKMRLTLCLSLEPWNQPVGYIIHMNGI